MPKETFERLKLEKKNSIIRAFLKEFTLHNYDDASISNVLKELKIAKGSFYQYFDDKLDLFQFLQVQCGKTKQNYIQHVIREDFNDFWEYWKALYLAGIKFDKKEPLMSNFLATLPHNMNSLSIRPIYKDWRKQVLEGLEYLVSQEDHYNSFRNDLSHDKIAHFIFNMGIQLYDYIRYNDPRNFESRLAQGEPIFQGKTKQLLLETMDDYIKIMRAALAPNEALC